MRDEAEIPAAGTDGSVTVAGACAVGAWLVGVVSIASMIANGWVPLDEGTTLLAARWVEGGALPHRDFAYPYTGGLTLLHAFALRIGGDSMLAPRITLLAAFALWLPAIWILARRFVDPQVAALAVVVCAWWSVLVYPAAMPTWYVLFCATWATVALAGWHDSARLRWVLLAGVAAGIAVTFKQTGLATLVGAGFGVLAIHQHRDAVAGSVAKTAGRDVLTLSLLAVAMSVPLAIVMRRGIGSGEALTIALPLAAAIVTLGARTWHAPTSETSTRKLLIAWGVLVGGALIPIVGLVAWFGAHGAMDSLVTANTAGMIRTATTIEQAMTPWPTMLTYGVPTVVILVGWAYACSRLRSSTAALVFGGTLGVVVLLAGAKFTVAYRGVWFAAQLVLPLAAVVMCRRAAATDPMPLVVVAAAALLAINQVPLGAPNYFAYVAPLGFLAALGASAAFSRRTVLTVLVALVAFGGWFHRIGSVHTVGFGPVWWDDAHALPGAHGKLRVTTGDSATYDRLTALVAEHGGAERFIAGPELGALYALAGTRRVIAQPYLLTDDPHGDAAAVAAAIDTATVRAIVLNGAPRFLPTVSAGARGWIEARYPNVERVGSVDFRWR